MTIKDLFDETFAALTANKARSALTVLGIVIGISSVIAMISIGQGAQASIQASIQSIGSNLIIVTPGAQRTPGQTVSTGRGSAKTLLQSDADAMKTAIANISGVAPELSGRYQVTSKGKNTNTSVVGVTSAYSSVRNVSSDQGTFITDSNVSSAAKVAVLGPTARDDLFGVDGDALGKTIRVSGIQFTIIGVTAAKGGSGFGSQDDMIFIPISTAQRFLVGDTTVSTISIQGANAAELTTLQQDVTTLLLDRHHISNPQLADFSVLNQADIVATASSVTGIFTTLLAAVAGISLIVGGIGIMNMMLTNVTERTKEIGLRKAIGAKQHEIRQQFLAEAVVLTLCGGAVGIALGWIIAWAVTALGFIQTQVSWSSIFLAFGVSALIGVVFGYYPARRAAKLNPIDALRFE